MPVHVHGNSSMRNPLEAKFSGVSHISTVYCKDDSLCWGKGQVWCSPTAFLILSVNLSSSSTIYFTDCVPRYCLVILKSSGHPHPSRKKDDLHHSRRPSAGGGPQIWHLLRFLPLNFHSCNDRCAVVDANFIHGHQLNLSVVRIQKKVSKCPNRNSVFVRCYFVFLVIFKVRVSALVRKKGTGIDYSKWITIANLISYILSLF